MDDRLAMAISHWAPRSTTNGVTAADFDRITRDLPSWDEWCPAWSAVAAEHEQFGRDALKAGRMISAGEHLSQAAVYFHCAKFLLVSDLVQMRAAPMSGPDLPDRCAALSGSPGRRVEIPFEGSRLAGVLRQSAGPGPLAVMIMISGFDSAKEELRSTEGLFRMQTIVIISAE
jgi:hypothetical protein